MVRQRILMGASFPAQQARVLCQEIDRDLGVTALGNSQGTAYKLKGSLTQFTTVAAATGAILDGTSDIGDEFDVVNFGANPLAVYPPVGGKINNGAANASVNVAANTWVYFKRMDAVNWISK